MNHECYDILSKISLPDAHLISLEEFERGDEELLGAKQNRTAIEYYFTCTPSLPLFILDNYPEVDIITYLDSDLFFYCDPAPLYDELSNYSISIIEHRFTPQLKQLERYGIYNVSWLSFRRDKNSIACLRWWRARCVEWCFDRVGNGLFADQKYLDNWPSNFKNIVVLRHKGANLAPWNIGNYTIAMDDAGVLVDDEPLIFFHFHGLRQINSWLFDPNLSRYNSKLSRIARRQIYAPYIKALSDVNRLALHCPKTAVIQKSIREPSEGERPVAATNITFRRAARFLNRNLGLCKGISEGKYIIAINGIAI